MNISSIPGSSSNSHPVEHRKSVPSSSSHQPVALAGSGQNPEDIVQLSQGVQIQQLAQAGESASLIASSTGLSISQVDLDLGISTTAPNVAVAVLGGQSGGPAVDGVQAASSTAAPAAVAASATPALSVTA